LEYTINEMARVLGVLIDEGVDFVVIGDTVIQLALRRKKLVGDIDLFALNPSPLAEEEFYMSLAEKYGWGYGVTEIGTPRLVARTGSIEIILEVYENFMDIDIPLEIIEGAGSIKLGDKKIKLIKPEQYLVLKARQGVDLDKLAKYARELKSINLKIVYNTVKLYPKEEQNLIIERLKSIGLKLK
jgi:predicted nucleotidyltransferase